jgi:hypothetical protein
MYEGLTLGDELFYLAIVLPIVFVIAGGLTIFKKKRK